MHNMLSRKDPDAKKNKGNGGSGGNSGGSEGSGGNSGNSGNSGNGGNGIENEEKGKEVEKKRKPNFNQLFKFTMKLKLKEAAFPVFRC